VKNLFKKTSFLFWYLCHKEVSLSIESPFLDHYEFVFPAYLKSLLYIQKCQETESAPLEMSAANKPSVPPYCDHGENHAGVEGCAAGGELVRCQQTGQVATLKEHFS